MKEFIVSYSVKDGTPQDYMRIGESLKVMCKLFGKHTALQPVKIMDNLYLVSTDSLCTSTFIFNSLTDLCDERFEFVVADVSGTLKGSKSVIARYRSKQRRNTGRQLK